MGFWAQQQADDIVKNELQTSNKSNWKDFSMIGCKLF